MSTPQELALLFILLVVIAALVYWFFRSPVPPLQDDPPAKWPEPDEPSCSCRKLPPPPPRLTPADSLSPYEQTYEWAPPELPLANGSLPSRAKRAKSKTRKSRK